MNSKNMGVLVNIIGAVESGGQVYGQRNYRAYAGPYTNSSIEYTITLGWAQNYGDEANKLIKMIYNKDPSGFKRIDSGGSIQSMLNRNWVSMRWNPSAAQRNILIALEDSAAGHQCQDELFSQLMGTFISSCYSTYTHDVAATMIYCEVRHLGGKNPADRIFKSCGGNYSLDNLYAHLTNGSGNQVNAPKFRSRHQKCVEFIRKYADLSDKSATIAGYSGSSASIASGLSTGSSSGADVSNAFQMPKLIFVGDSRTVGMKSSVGSDNNIWICKNGAGYDWLVRTAFSQIDSQVGSNTAVVIMLGIDDFTSKNDNKYVSAIKTKAAQWKTKGARTYFVSVNPVRKSGYGSITNTDIEIFNSSLKTQFGDIQT